MTALLAVGLPRVRSEFGYRVLLGDGHESIVRLDALIEQFGGGLPVRIAWECGPNLPCGQALDESSLRMADALVSRLSSIDGTRSVWGPSNAPILVPTADGFSVRRLIEHGRMAPDSHELATLALQDPMWAGELVNADATVAVVVIQPSDTRSATEVSITEDIEDVLMRFADAGFEFYVTGDAYENTIGGRDLASSSAIVIPLAIVVIGLVLLLSCGSFPLAAAILGSMGIALTWTFGALGWLSWPRDGILEVLAPVVLVVGVCDAMHFVSRYLSNRGEIADARAATMAAAVDVGPACLVTTLTTAVAFLSFTTSDLETFVRFGFTSAFGVISCLLTTFTLLPIALTTVSPGVAPRSSASWTMAIDRIVATSRAHHASILFGAIAAGAVFAAGWVAFLRVDTNWLESWGERSELTRSIRFMEDRFGASETLELHLRLPSGAAAHDADVLQVLSTLTKTLEETGEFESTLSVVRVVERLNRLLHGDDPAFEHVPENPGTSAELLEIASLDDAGLLSSLVSLDGSQLRISARSPARPYAAGSALIERTQSILRSVLPVEWDAEMSGELTMTVDWVRDVQATQLRSFPVAAFLVLMVVSLHLRSLRLGIAAVLPTLLPVVVTLGAMGWLGMSLDVGRAMIAAVLIGIGVDDAVHVLTQYKRRCDMGVAPADAITEALAQTGQAVITTSLALSLGFLTLMASAWQTISSFGFFVALAIMGALLSTLLVLPALIFFASRHQVAK